uniref:Radical SAM domain protein n=1 Tax=mine drainage metagenome TaxID=410659 RepID=E6PFG9_9ZZZZ
MSRKRARLALAYADARGRYYFDETCEPLADGGIVRSPRPDELIPAPPGSIPTLLPLRRPLSARGLEARRHALGVLLPAGYTRLLVPAFEAEDAAPTLPLFGYTFACAIDDELYVAAMRTDRDEDWEPRRFAEGELEALLDERCSRDPGNRMLAQLRICAGEYGCFTAQNVFLARGEAALPVSPKCNARCVGCISEQEPDAGLPSPQRRIDVEMQADEIARVAIEHLAVVPEGIVSFGQGCEGEPLLRSHAIAAAIEKVRSVRKNGTVNLNTNGSRPRELARCIDAGLQAVRISLNSFRDSTYAAYYRPQGYALGDVFDSIRIARAAGLRVSLNLLTHPGVTDDVDEVAAMEEFLSEQPVDMVQTRTLNIDPHRYFALVGRPQATLGMRVAIDRIAARGVRVGNFTHVH